MSERTPSGPEIQSYDELANFIGFQVDVYYVYSNAPERILFKPSGSLRIQGVLYFIDEYDCYYVSGTPLNKDAYVRDPGTFPVTINRINFQAAAPSLSNS